MMSKSKGHDKRIIVNVLFQWGEWAVVVRDLERGRPWVVAGEKLTPIDPRNG